MPLTRYQIRNEYGLADLELYKAAERDDPEALLEGVAMAGLVGVLRQLGDLAEFAAEIFHDLHEEVVATAARGHGLVARVQQLEADFPSIEKAFLSQTSHSPFFSAPGIDWHPNMRSQQNLVTRGDLPRFVMDSYEECRGPPRLFLLDKFDVAGAGACLKRYTDPSFLKVESKSHKVPTGDAQREKKMRKVKKKAARMRNGEASEIAPTSHSKLHQLLMEERIENGYNNPPRALKIKKRNLNGYPFDSKTGKSYMVQFVETPSPEHKVVHEVPVSPRRLKFRPSSTSQIAKDVIEIDTVNHIRKSPQRNERSCSPPYAPEVQYKPSIDDVVKEEVVDRLSEVVPVLSSDGEIDETPSSPHEVMDKKIYGYPSDDVTSDVDNYVDARTTLESEIESGNEFRIKNDSDAYEEDLKFQTDLADSESVANSSASTDDNGSYKKEMSSTSFSDTSTSNLAENAAPSDGDGADKVSSSSEHGVAEVMEAPSNKLSTSDVLESESDELEVPSDKYVEEIKIPNTNLSTGEVAEPKSGELEVPNDTSTEELKITDTRATSCGTISSSSNETEINLADSSDVLSSIPSQNGDHNDVDKFSNGDPDFISDAQLHSSNVSEGASENKGSDCSGSEVLQAIATDRNCTESINSGEICSPHSVSPTDEQVLISALPEVEASLVTVSEVDYAISPTEANSESLVPKVDVPEPCNSTEEQLSDIPDDVPQPDGDLDEISGTLDNQETDRHSCNADDTEKEADLLEVPCHANYADVEDFVVETEAKQEVNQLEAALTDSVSYSESKLGVLDDDEDTSVTEQDQISLQVGDVTTTSIPSQVRNHVPEPVSLQSDDLLEYSEDALPPSTSSQETGVPLQEFSRLQVDQVHIENLQVHEEQLQSPIYTDQVLHFDVSKSSPEDLPDQAALPELPQQSQSIGLTDSCLPNFPREFSSAELLQPAGQGNQAVDGLGSSLPFFGIFPEATPDHMEMPPLPPLPPMQWRMGKVHSTPFPSLGGSFQCNQDSCDAVPSSGADEKEKLGFLPAVQDERSYTLQVPNMVNDLAAEVKQSPDTFLTSPAISDDRAAHASHMSGGETIQSSYIPLPLQSPGTFLTSPAISDDRAAHASHMSGGETIQSSYIPLPLQAVGDATSTHDPVSSQGNLMQAPNQLTAETASDAKMLEHISKDVEGQGDTSLYKFAPPPSIEDDQPRNGEIAWYPKTSAFVPFFEVPKQNGNSTMKIPRPRSPLIDAVAAHDKSTLRKVTERVRPQNEPKVGERDSLLEQIRTKSFSLKPAVVTRPSIQGPKTNLKVAAILEKANAIRQALAGSDDDDDTESNWSDS